MEGQSDGTVTVSVLSMIVLVGMAVLTLLAGLRDQIGLRGKCLGSHWNELTLCHLEEWLHVLTIDRTEVLGNCYTLMT
jgi:hypothetical protein